MRYQVRWQDRDGKKYQADWTTNGSAALGMAREAARTKFCVTIDVEESLAPAQWRRRNKNAELYRASLAE